MGSTTDKLKGTGNQIAGKTKQAVGDMTDDRELHAEGAMQEAKGDMQKAVGNAKDTVKKAVDKL